MAHKKKKKTVRGKIAFDFSRLPEGDIEFMDFLEAKIKDGAIIANIQEVSRFIEIIQNALSVPRSNLHGYSDNELFSAFWEQKYQWNKKQVKP